MMMPMGSYVRRGKRLLRKAATHPKLRSWAEKTGYFLGGLLLSAASLGNHPQPLPLAALCAGITGIQGMLLALVLIPALYYTYTGALGVSADWFNVTIFFITAAVMFYTETRMLREGRSCRLGGGVSILLLLAVGALFILFTFAAPRIPLFRDPVTGTYGLQNQEYPRCHRPVRHV